MLNKLRAERKTDILLSSKSILCPNSQYIIKYLLTGGWCGGKHF